MLCCCDCSAINQNRKAKMPKYLLKPLLIEFPFMFFDNQEISMFRQKEKLNKKAQK